MRSQTGAEVAAALAESAPLLPAREHQETGDDQRRAERDECVKTKRRAQARIYEQTKDLTPEELVAHYERLGEAARQRQAELRARSDQPAK